eukprot:SAG22_NODE_2211_length_2832_cov_2.111965_3_plen_214_part_00
MPAAPRSRADRRLRALAAHVHTCGEVASPAAARATVTIAVTGSSATEPARRLPDGSWTGGGIGGDPGLAADVASFREHGFLKVPGLISGGLLARAQAAFAAAQPAARQDWEDGLASGAAKGGPGLSEGRGAAGTWHAPRYFDTPKILEQDDVWLEVIEEPRLLALASSIIGDDLHLFQIQARTYPADRHLPGHTDAEEELAGYAGWHRCDRGC